MPFCNSLDVCKASTSKAFIGFFLDAAVEEVTTGEGSIGGAATTQDSFNETP